VYIDPVWPTVSLSASLKKARLMGRIGSGPCLVGQIGLGVRVSASFLKNVRLVGRLGSGPRLVGRIGSGVQVRASFKKHARLVGRLVLRPGSYAVMSTRGAGDQFRSSVVRCGNQSYPHDQVL